MSRDWGDTGYFQPFFNGFSELFDDLCRFCTLHNCTAWYYHVGSSLWVMCVIVCGIIGTMMIGYVCGGGGGGGGGGVSA